MAVNKDGFEVGKEITFDQINQFNARKRQELKNAESKPKRGRTKKETNDRSNEQPVQDSFVADGAKEA